MPPNHLGFCAYNRWDALESDTSSSGFVGFLES
jgi:hypothetical protein